jgi:hypothetical protein
LRGLLRFGESCAELANHGDRSFRFGGDQMKRWLWPGVGLIAVLFCFWLVLTKLICRDGFAASLGTRSGWTSVANDN